MSDENANEANAIIEVESEVVANTPVSLMPIGPESGELAVQRAVATYKAVTDLVDAVFEDKVDYDHLPNDPNGKKNLLLPGGEKVMTLLGLREEYHDIETIRIMDPGAPFFYFEVEARLYDINSGHEVARGQAIMNTREKSFMRRGRVCPTCEKPAIMRSKFKPRNQPNAEKGWWCNTNAGGCNAQFDYNDSQIQSQEDGNINDPQLVWDGVNRCRKIANKRALLQAVKRIGMLSSRFTVDMDQHRSSPPSGNDKPPTDSGGQGNGQGSQKSTRPPESGNRDNALPRNRRNPQGNGKQDKAPAMRHVNLETREDVENLCAFMYDDGKAHYPVKKRIDELVKANTVHSNTSDITIALFVVMRRIQKYHGLDKAGALLALNETLKPEEQVESIPVYVSSRENRKAQKQALVNIWEAVQTYAPATPTAQKTAPEAPASGHSVEAPSPVQKPPLKRGGESIDIEAVIAKREQEEGYATVAPPAEDDPPEYGEGDFVVNPKYHPPVGQVKEVTTKMVKVLLPNGELVRWHKDKIDFASDADLETYAQLQREYATALSEPFDEGPVETVTECAFCGDPLEKGFVLDSKMNGYCNDVCKEAGPASKWADENIKEQQS